MRTEEIPGIDMCDIYHNNESVAVNLNSPGSSSFSRLRVFLVLALTVAVIVGGVGVFNLVKRTQQRLAQKSAMLAVELKTDYENPFDQNTQYVDPFDESKNPLRNL